MGLILFECFVIPLSLLIYALGVVVKKIYIRRQVRNYLEQNHITPEHGFSYYETYTLAKQLHLSRDKVYYLAHRELARMRKF